MTRKKQAQNGDNMNKYLFTFTLALTLIIAISATQREKRTGAEEDPKLSQNGTATASPVPSKAAESPAPSTSPVPASPAPEKVFEELPVNKIRAAQKYSAETRGQALVIMQGGKVILEEYCNGGANDRMQMLASGSKSFVGIAAVAAVCDGFIKLDDFASESLSEWKEHQLKSKITYRQLLTLTSGLTSGERGSVLRTPSWNDIVQKPLTGRPAEQYSYGAYQLIAFSEALERKLGGEKFEDYIKRRIFAPLGINVEWRMRCADGHPQVGGGAYMTARDWALFGEFVRLGGKWGDKQLLKPDTLAECFIGTVQNPAYGLAWWLKKPVSKEIIDKIPLLSREWADAANSKTIPDDLVAACGAGKQRLYVIPSRGLVIARNASIASTFSDSKFLSLLFN